MNLFIDLHWKLLTQLLLTKVDFIIIGGYSVIFHGYERTTGDIDIWLKPDNANKEKLLAVLKEFGIIESELKDIREADFSKHLMISIWDKPEQVDFLTHINLVQYNEADKLKVLFEWEGYKVPFIHINHLVLSKMNTGRLQDKADIEELQKIISLGKSK